jgi:hypothetical protein
LHLIVFSHEIRRKAVNSYIFVGKQRLQFLLNQQVRAGIAFAIPPSKYLEWREYEIDLYSYDVPVAAKYGLCTGN